MNTTITIKRAFATAVAATTFFAVAACGTEVSPPAQDIAGASHTAKKQTKTPSPVNTSGSRMDFGDDYGKASIRTRNARVFSKGSGNRDDFRHH